MNLTFTKTRHGGISGAAPDGTSLFNIGQSTSRNEEKVIVQASLPGMASRIVIDAPEGRTKWDRETNMLAFRAAADSLEQWASNVLGVTLTVNVVYNT